MFNRSLKSEIRALDPALSKMPLVVNGLPALILAPMEGYIDSPMRNLLTRTKDFSFCVSEFVRVSAAAPAKNTFLRNIPELAQKAQTSSGVPVQVQLLGGDAEKMAQAALNAVAAGATSIDVNFGCPAPTVNRHDGGATLLKFPERIEEILKTMRQSLPLEIPLSAKLRLGWDSPQAIFKNAESAQRGGVSWITIHARTKFDGYKPPAHWAFIGEVRKTSSVPVVANGEILNLDDLRRCQEQTGCEHFMIGRGMLADPNVAALFAGELKLGQAPARRMQGWTVLSFWLRYFEELCESLGLSENYRTRRLKQWLMVGHLLKVHSFFEAVKRLNSAQEIIKMVEAMEQLL